MKAMILAAGCGERMRPLTDRIPKPLLEAGGKPLIQYHIESLRDAGFRELVINHAHLGAQLVEHLGSGEQLGVRIRYSAESEGALETGGGIKRALTLLGEQPFLVVNGDIWTDYPYARLQCEPDGLAHLVLIDNPAHNPDGDFQLSGDKVTDKGKQKLTFSGIGVYRPGLFAAVPEARFPLAPVLCDAMQDEQVSGEYYPGQWMDVGSPQRLAELDKKLRG